MARAGGTSLWSRVGPATPFFVGCVLVFLGERVAPGGAWRLSLDGAGGAALAASLLMRWRAVAGASGAARWGERVALLATVAGCVAVGLHFASLDVVWDRLRPSGGELRERAQVLLQVGWPLLWALSAGPLVMLERSLAPHRAAGSAEPLRLRAALATGLELPLALALLCTLNWLAARHDVQVDLSYFRVGRAGESTRKRVAALQAPLEVLLFFPEANEVGDRVREYLAPLQRLGPGLVVRRMERLLLPDLARRLDVRTDGVLTLVRGERHERVYLGTTMLAARSRLRKLDGEFHRALVRIGGPERVAYLLRGHGERGSGGGGDFSQSGLRGLEELLRMQGFTTRQLGLAEGLGAGVPADAALVLLLGPRSPLLPEELRALHAWFGAGGRLLLALDPEPGHTHPGLLEPLRLRFDPVFLAADANYLRRSFTPADRRNLVTNVYQSHPVVESLMKPERAAGFLVLGSGHLEPLADRPASLRLHAPVRSLAAVWRDANGDLRPSPGERRRAFDLVAAVEQEREGPPGRALVMADVDALTDAALANQGNALLLDDGLRWLAGEEQLSGGLQTDTDSPVLHSRESDRLWFYGTIFGAPLLVFGLGFALRRRRRP